MPETMSLDERFAIAARVLTPMAVNIRDGFLTEMAFPQPCFVFKKSKQ